MSAPVVEKLITRAVNKKAPTAPGTSVTPDGREAGIDKYSGTDRATSIIKKAGDAPSVTPTRETDVQD